MPFSDFPPPMVFPDSPEGWLWRDYERPDIHVHPCGEYRPAAHEVVTSSDLSRLRRIRACANRRVDGEMRHNWCLRCIAGFIALDLHSEDSDGMRQRAVRFS